jgi:glycosyltransferase involved in cell wall biosynthesis
MPLRVCIDARLAAGHSGGVEQVVVGLAAHLSKLTDGEEEYLFLAHPDQDEWIRPHLSGPCRVLRSRLDYPGQGGLVPSLRRAVRQRLRGPVLRSDGTIEREGVELIHFPMQEAFLTEVPSVYQPHDLQHLHLPEMFSPGERQRREVVYRAHCERAAMVSLMTSWGRRDVIDSYGLPEEKVKVVTWGSVLSEFPPPSPDEVEATRAGLSLPDEFLIYPAQTWPHKNHLALLEALALIRERDGVTIPVVCPGKRNEHYSRIQERLEALDLEGIVSFPGFISSTELRGLYELARGMVFPSRFEGWGMPVTEAFAYGLPVACSSATGLPDVVGDAGLLFDPENPGEMGESVLRLWTDPGLRDALIDRGRKRSELFSVDRSVRLFRAHYRRISGKRLSDEDRILLASEPLA